MAGERRLTFRDACDVAATMAGALRAAGVATGDRVALMCGNRFEFMQVYLGCAWLGAVAVPINVASRGAQLEHILRNCGARLMVMEAELLPVLSAFAGRGLPLANVWLIGDAPAPHSYLTLHALPQPVLAIEPHAARPDETVAILYTSGTTGVSKAVCCPQAQYFWWGAHTAQLLEVMEGDVLWSPLPLFHTNALNTFYQALLTGATFVSEPKFSVSGFAASLVKHQATVVYLLGVPARFHDQFRERFGIGIVDGYGSTESNFVIGAPLARQQPGSMGWVRPGFQARVVDDLDNELPPGEPGEPGELVLRSDEPFAFATGYFQMPQQTVAAWRNLWFHSGDRVVRDADGSFRFMDRLKDAIRRRGENISSHEVEQAIASHAAVAYAAVFPVPSELAEDEVMAAVVLREGSTLTPEQLLDHCQPLLPYFAVPRFVEFMAELPTNETGKVQKFKLRERGVTPSAWDRDAAGYKVTR